MSINVVFRVFEGGEVIAFFPSIASTMAVDECMSYVFVGQHGSASTSHISNLRIPSSQEYEDLLEHLQDLYDDELVVNTWPSQQDTEERRETIRQWRRLDRRARRTQ